MEKFRLIWADDEIDLLKPHILFLQEKGYHVDTARSGDDALEMISGQPYDLVFLDENMPGISGLEALARIKQQQPQLPVVMVTKSEEEYIMEDAIGSKISDYLIKPVNPRQLLSSVKKILDNKRLVDEKNATAYQAEFRELNLKINERLTLKEWEEVYRKLVFWELELERNQDESLRDIWKYQKNEANNQFGKFVKEHYLSWINGTSEETPVLSHTLFSKRVAPLLLEEDPLFFILIDNLRLDQWKVIQPLISEYFKIQQEELYCSILPTSTQYSRNAIFSGLMPSEIEKKFPKLWSNDEEEGGKNLHEEEFLADQMRRLGKQFKFTYHKIIGTQAGKKMVEQMKNLFQNRLNVIVYNFVDMLSHARTEMDMIRELAEDDPAYRSLTESWFEHSTLFEAMKIIAEKKGRMVITTDHGTIRVTEPSRLQGDRNTNTNLRYKQGKSLDYIKGDVFEIRNPADAYLPRVHVSSSFVFALNDKFFAYPNNYNHYVNYYRNTFQHGGISLEEMMIPYVYLTAR